MKGIAFNTEINLLILSSIGLLFYERWLRYLMFSIPVSFYFVTWYFKYQNILQDTVPVTQIFSPINAFIITFVVTLVYRKSYLETEALIIQQNTDLKEKNEKVQELNQLKDRLFSVIAHDLRSPINTIQGMLLLAKDKVISAEEFPEYVSSVSKATDSTSSLLENLLAWSHQQIHGVSMVTIKFDLSSMVIETLGSFEFAANEKQLTITNRVSSETMVRSSPDAISLILRNLIGNAIKFCSPGNKILLTSEPYEKGWLKVSVEDSGVGIAPEQIDKLFVVYGNSTRGTQNEKGSGLGLKLCRTYVESLGGKIWVESELEKGTTFHFTIQTD